MKPLIVANWKCNPTTSKEAKLLFDSVKKGTENIKNVEAVICPPFLYISNLESQITNLKLGGQDCFWEEKGAYTGEVSPMMLKDLGCEYVIIGHSERRGYFNESDEMINKKIKAALLVNLKVIFCVGETLEEKNSGNTEKVIESQIKNGLKGIIEEGSLSNLILAYEPIWAIGTGKACGVSEAGLVNSFIKKLVKNLPLLYGGSVNSQNARDYIKMAGFQGLLVGGASLNPEEFIEILRRVSLA